MICVRCGEHEIKTNKDGHCIQCEAIVYRSRTYKKRIAELELAMSEMVDRAEILIKNSIDIDYFYPFYLRFKHLLEKK